MSNGWSLPAMPVVPVSPVGSPAALLGDAIVNAPQTAADQTAKLAKTQADTAKSQADLAEDTERKNEVPAIGAATIADAQGKTLASNLGSVKQYAQILRANPAAANSPLIRAALAPFFKALGTEIPMTADGSGIDVDAMERLATPQPSWSDLTADQLKAWEQQPESVRRAKFPDAPESWLAKPVTVPMTATSEQDLYDGPHGINAQIDQVGKGLLQPTALLSSIKAARARLAAAEMSTAAVDQYLSPDGTDLSDSLKQEIVGAKVDADIQHYRDLGLHYQDDDKLRAELQAEHMREFDKNYALNAGKLTLAQRHEQAYEANLARVAQQGADRLSQGWQNITLRQNEFSLNANKFAQSSAISMFRSYDQDFQKMVAQLETNKRAIQTAINAGHPPKPDSDLMKSTEQLQQTLYGTPAQGNQPATPGLAAQVDFLRSRIQQLPAAQVTQTGGNPATVTHDGSKPSSPALPPDARVSPDGKQYWSGGHIYDRATGKLVQ